MSRALLIGYYGYSNTGDDAFLAVSAWGAAHVFGHHEMWATTRQPLTVCGYTIQPVYGRSWFPRQNVLRAYWRASRVNQVIFGGGSNFHTRTYMDEWCRWLDLAGAGPHRAVGVSIGPFRDHDAEDACARLLSRLTFVGVRDAASYERAVKLAPGTTVEYTFDLAPLLPLAAQATIPAGTQERRGLGIALCNYERFIDGDIAGEMRRVEQVAAAIQRAAQRGRLDELVLIDFNGDARGGDHQVHCALIDLLGGVIPVRHVCYVLDPMQAMNTIAGLRGIIAMRLHAAVFAYVTETPALLLAYHEKCHEWARTVGADTSLIFNAFHLESEALATGIHQMFSAYTRPKLPLFQAQQRALRNWTRA